MGADKHGVAHEYYLRAIEMDDEKKQNFCNYYAQVLVKQVVNWNMVNYTSRRQWILIRCIVVLIINMQRY